MKPMAMAAAFLEEHMVAFCVFMAEHGAGDGASKDVIDALRRQGAPAGDRLCPHNDMHDRLRRSIGYVRDGEDGHKSVCFLCWLENIKDQGRFHSPHGSIPVMLFTMLRGA